MKLKNLSAAPKALPSLLLLVLMASHGVANAALTTAITNGGNLIQGIVTIVAWICALGGICAVLSAGMMVWKKSDEQRGDQVEWSKVAILVGAGALLGTGFYFLGQSVELFGGSAADIGKTIVLPH